MLQTRSAKRPGAGGGALRRRRIRGAAAQQGGGDRDDRRRLRSTRCCTPSFDSSARYTVLARGVAASPGAAKGTIVFTAHEAVDAARRGRVVDPRAPVHRGRRRRRVPRGRRDPDLRGREGVPCGARRARYGPAGGDRCERPRDRRSARRRSASVIACCTAATSSRSTGRPARSRPTTSRSPRRTIDDRFETMLRWSDELRTIGVRANADTPEDARRAHRFGAEGIGLCRTEHMFMAADRQPKMRAMIMASDEAGRRERARRAAAVAAERLRGALRGDEGLAGDDPAARPAAARVPAGPVRAPRGDRAGSAGPQSDARRARTAVRAGALAGGDEPDARDARRAGSASCTRRSTRCRCARSRARRSPSRAAAGRRRSSRS